MKTQIQNENVTVIELNTEKEILEKFDNNLKLDCKETPMKLRVFSNKIEMECIIPKRITLSHELSPEGKCSTKPSYLYEISIRKRTFWFADLIAMNELIKNICQGTLTYP
jgi:hypothetical protein